MFTGIIEEIGKVLALRQRGAWHELRIGATKALEGTKLGDSISINGVCLTVTLLTGDSFSVEMQPETLRRTNLGELKAGEGVNLERALAFGGRMGGHFVQGHIDGTAKILERSTDGPAVVLRVSAPSDLSRYIVPKGFIAVDGISLTVVEASTTWFTLSLIAYTQEVVTLSHKSAGDTVNIEVDVLGKYIERILAWRFPDPAHPVTPGGVSEELLKVHGYLAE